MNNDQETVLAGLLTYLGSALRVAFTGNATMGSPILQNISTTKGLVTGLPVTGAGVPLGAFVQAFDAVAKTVTLSGNMTAPGTAVSFTAGMLAFGRRLPSSDPTEQPALYLVHLESEDAWSNVRNARSRIEGQIWIYTKSGADDVPSTLLNALIYALKNSFAPDNFQTGTFTIGGLCSWCRIEGKSLYYPGDGADQAVVVVPVVITLP